MQNLPLASSGSFSVAKCCFESGRSCLSVDLGSAGTAKSGGEGCLLIEVVSFRIADAVEHSGCEDSIAFSEVHVVAPGEGLK